MTNTVTIQNDWTTEDLAAKNERHYLPTPETQLSKHVVSKLCFCRPEKSYPYDVTLFTHRNITRVQASEEVIYRKRLAKKVSERLEKEIAAEMAAEKKVAKAS
jgi:hypothetical protein